MVQRCGPFTEAQVQVDQKSTSVCEQDSSTTNACRRKYGTLGNKKRRKKRFYKLVHIVQSATSQVTCLRTTAQSNLIV